MKYLNLTLATLALLVMPMTTSGDETLTKPRVKLTTTLGDIVVELDQEKAPITVKNFLGYVNDGFFEGTIFHRVMPNFMIQAGGFDVNMDQKSKGRKPPIKLESDNGLKNLKYTIAMARTGAPNSATNQFFINARDNAILDYKSSQRPGYAVFGKVVEGQDVVEKIRATECELHPKYKTRDGAVTPKVAVVIKKATVLNAVASAKEPPAKATPRKDE